MHSVLLYSKVIFIGSAMLGVKEITTDTVNTIMMSLMILMKSPRKKI